MRVAHLPFNIASQITATVRGLRDVGIEARGLAKSGVITSNDYVELFPPRPKGLRGYWTPLDRYFRTLRLIAWADVVHWHYGWALHGALDVHFARLLNKKMCVEYWGSDIRIGEVEAADNALYAALPADQQEAAARDKSEELQRTFIQVGAKTILPCPSLVPHLVDKEHCFLTRQRIYLDDFRPTYPDHRRGMPIVLHAPSSRLMKGTSAVNAAVEELQRRGVQFEYKQIESMQHDEALATMAGCDVYVDQLIIGSHGIAALEAMALGKAVICYIKPSMRDKYPPELPIVSADPQTLPEVLAGLLADGERLSELGRQGRAYVERYHDARVLCRELAHFYESL
jgi:glycosyltransferase involved in cell wall biosynthesis